MLNSDERHLIVLGAGLAGLSAAEHLVRGGCRVTVIETQDRVGGRALSLDKPFSSGLVAETGPARFPADFRRVIALAQRFNLELEPFYPNMGLIVGLLDGQRIVGYIPNDEQFWGYRIRASRLGAIVWRMRGRLPQRMYHLKGGTHQLPIAMAESLEAKIMLRSEAIAIEQQPGAVRVKVRSPRGELVLEADRVVCALPLSALLRLSFLPELPSQKARLFSSIASMAAVRIFFQMSSPFWLQDGLNGFAFTDTIGEVWAPDFSSPREPTLMVCYAQRDLAERLCALKAPERIERVLNELEKVFPGARQHVQSTATHSWREQSWIDGAWPLVRDGFRDQIPHLRAPHGRIHFAGDYAASPRFLNMMEGALQSGEHAAKEVLTHGGGS